MDRFTKQQRSRAMAAVRGMGNKSTELAILRLLKRMKIKGWRRHSDFVFGRPDFSFTKQKVAIFVDGCFWHGCSKHRNIPKTNLAFWKAKIFRNKERDKAVNKKLKKNGWKIFRVWEHEIKNNPAKVIVKLENLIEFMT